MQISNKRKKFNITNTKENRKMKNQVIEKSVTDLEDMMSEILHNYNESENMFINSNLTREDLNEFRNKVSKIRLKNIRKSK